MAEPQTGERPSVSRGVGGGGLQGVVAVGGAGLGQGGSGEDGVGDGLFGALDALCGFDDFVDAVGGHYQGAVYVTDSGNDRVLRLSAGSTTPATLPFTDLKDPWGVAVDAQGAVYVADSGNARVLTLAAGSTTPATLPFIDPNYPQGVAVDAQGGVYVTDFPNHRVLRLPASSTN